jgi:hypothetical protein
VVLLAVAPLAAAPGLLGTEVPGVSIAQQFSGATLGNAVGIGVAVSIGGVMLCEYLALTRLVHAVGGWSIRPAVLAVGAAVLLAAPISLIDPEGFYSALIKPSLAGLWVSQLLVFLVYPRFAARHGQRSWLAWLLTLGASALAIYALWLTFQHAAS